MYVMKLGVEVREPYVYETSVDSRFISIMLYSSIIFLRYISDIFKMKNHNFKRVCSLQRSSVKILRAAADISSC